ncbi:MAG: choice-of-anchor Q domain-containing protein [Pseudomonadota bacterium]
MPVTRLCGRPAVPVFAALFLLFLSTTVQGQTTHTVCLPTNLAAPCDYDSPDLALADNINVVAGDTLEIENDTYVVSSELFIDRSLTLNFNGALLDATGVRAIRVQNAGTVANIDAVSIENGEVTGLGDAGGGILVLNSELNLTNSKLENNAASAAGGALSNNNSIVTVSDTDFVNNRTSGEGGAIVTTGAAVTTLNRVTIDGNLANGVGGAISANAGGGFNINDSVISRNAGLNPALDLDFLADNGTSLGCSPFQTFTAGVGALSGFSFNVRLNGGNPVPNDLPVQGEVRQGDQTGPVIATASAVLQGGLAGGSLAAIVFTLDGAPIALNLGDTYTISYTVNGGYSTLQSAVDYAGGNGFCNSFNQPDFAFQTFGGNPTVGGIYSEGAVNLTNVTVSDNVGTGAFAVSQAAGAPHTVFSAFSTFFGNSGQGVRGEVGTVSGLITLDSTIIAGSGAEDCLGDATSVDSEGFNVIEDDTGCGTGQNTGDQWGTVTSPIDPLLGPLQDNGGPTLSRALDPSSPAVEAGNPGCPAADQRGVSRPQGAACDAGAFELQPSVGPLQALIDAAAPGGTVVVPDGTYTESITLANSGITLQGSGPDNVVIDVTGLGTQGVFATESFTMTGIRVTGADFAGQGAGIDIQNPFLDVVLDNVRIDNNSASVVGGGIFVESQSNLTLTNSEILGNTAGSNGGGIYLDGGQTVTINNVSIANNTADNDGGGIYSQASTVLIGAPACTTPAPVGQNTNFISNNTATNGNGGGIWSQALLTLTYTQFSDNSAVNGGGIHQESTVSTLDMDCGFMNLNSADPLSGQGGAINIVDAANSGNAIVINDTTFESNDAGAGGGAINLTRGATITNSTFLTNSVPFGDGGAIRSPLGQLVSTDNTYRNNSSNANGGAISIGALLSTTDVFEDNSARQGGGAVSINTSGFAQTRFVDGLLQNNTVGEGTLSFSGRGGALEFQGLDGLVESTQFLNNLAPEAGDGGGQGGAIYIAASALRLSISDSTISGSNAGDGGAIYNEGTLSIARSTLTSNSATDANVEPRGGAIASTGTLTVVNSTISGNVVNPGPGNTGDGGAIASFGGGTADINNVTFAFNTAPDAGALYAEIGQGPLTFRNSLFSGNTGVTGDCDQVLSGGFNIYDVNPCPILAPDDLIGDPLIGLLTDNGGATDTHALLPGSPAQDAGGPSQVLFFDFQDLDEFTVRGDATLNNNEILLAGTSTSGGTVGSAYLTAPVDVTSDFQALFSFRIVPGSGGSASDGLTITFTDDPTLLTDGGGALGIGSFDDLGTPGYQPTGPQVPGVSVEFDTWLNGQGVGANELDEDHVGINVNGSMDSVAVQYFGSRGVLSSGNRWNVWVEYDADTNLLEVRLAEQFGLLPPPRPALPNVSATVNVLALADVNADGDVFVGFTGAGDALTGIGGEQRISNFLFANETSCELDDQRGVNRPDGARCDIGAFEGSSIPGTIDNAQLSVTTNVTQPGVENIPLVDIPIETLTGVFGDSANPPESAPLSSFPLSSFPLSSLNLQASPLSSFPLSSFPLSSFDVAGAPLSSFPLSSFPLLSEPGGWDAVIDQVPSLAGAPLQNVTLEQVLQAPDLPAGVLDNITLGALAIQQSPLSSLSLAGLSLGDNLTVGILDEWLANTGSSSTICGSLASEGFNDCQTSDTVVSLQVKSAPLSSLPLSSLPLSSFPLSSFGITEAPLSSFPLSSLPLSSFPLSSFPLSSFPLSSLPLSSFPLSSFPLSSFPLSSFDLLAAPLSSFPLSSFPLSSLPLSSFDVGGEPFCNFYNALAQASGQSTCSLLGIDPSTDGLLDLVAALRNGGTSSLASTPLSSFPLSSFDIANVPLSSFQLDFADVAGAPLSSFPLSSFPLSSFDVGGQAFCDFYDTAALAEGQSTCGDLGITNASNFGDLIVALQGAGESNFAATPLSSFPLSSFPLSSLPLSSFPLSSLEINGAPLSSFPMSAFDILGSPLSSLPLSSFPLSSFLIDGVACAGCTTVGDAFLAGQVIADAPLSSFFTSPQFGDVLYGDLLGSFTLEYLFGIEPTDPNTLGEIADPGNLTFGQLLVSLVLRSDFPWENITLSDLDPQSFAADNFVGYSVDFELNGTLVEPVTVNVTLSEEFHAISGSAQFTTQAQGGGSPMMSPVADPVMTPNPDGTVTMSFGPVSPGAFSDNTLQFVAVPPLTLGDFPATATLDLGVTPAATADATLADVEVVPSAINESDNINFPTTPDPDQLVLGHISATDDNDYFRISAPPKGSRITVFMSNPTGDNDLLLYEPLSAVEAKGQIVEAASLDSIPFEDDGINFAGNLTEEPDSLEDINLGVLPLSSLSTNRDNADEEVSAISDGDPFTIQVSGYNGSVSEDPYTLRIKVTPEVPVTQCPARTWPGVGAGPQTWTAAGSWTPATNAVFFVNWQRLAQSEEALNGGGAAAADAALNAVNALVSAPGVIDGVVIDVSTIPGVNYAAWDLDPCDVDAANSVVNAITAYIEAQRATSPQLAYVTIVGSDEVIPFQRKGDETAIANESTFATTFEDNALYGSMVNRNFLSDDTYGDIDPVRWFNRFLNVPELAVGRLVESPADIQTAAENYVLSGGLLTPSTALSAGYDFIADASTDIQQTFSAYGLNSTPLIDQPNAADPWDRVDFLTAAGLTTNTARDVVSFNMHFDYDEALPSSGDATGNYSTNLINVGDLLGNDLTGRVWFTVGCHSGINVADISVPPTQSSQDWSQTLNSLGAVYVGQAAYGLGDTVALALTERLLANFARNLNGNISAGQAHAFAKQEYFGDLGVYGEYDYKALQASVYFGLPMYQVQLPVLVETPLPTLRPTLNDPISGLTSASIDLASPLDYDIDFVDTEKGRLYSAEGVTVEGDVQFVHYRPLQPIIGVDVTSENPGEVARSAFITGLVTRDEIVPDMAFARPVIDEGALEPEVETDEVVFPTSFTNVTSYRVPADPGPFEERQQLNIIAGQYTSNAGEDFGTQRIFESVDVQVFYQPAPVVGLKTAAIVKGPGMDDVRPELDNINASVVEAGSGFQAAFTVDATDMAPGVVTRVAVLYRQSFDGVNSTWVLEDLVQSGSSNTWTGGGAVSNSGLVNGEVDYLVQALDNSGNVANSTFKGTFYVAEQTPLPPNPGGGGGEFGVTLEDSSGQPVTPGQWSTADPVIVAVSNLTPGVDYEFALDSPTFVPLTGDITVSGDGVHFVTVREVGGANSATFNVLIDTTAPTVVVSSPQDGQFVELSDETPLAAYDCLDSGSGPQTCAGPVATGAPLPTPPGTQSFAVSSSDFAENGPTSVQRTYYVLEALNLESDRVTVTAADPITVTGRITDLAGFSETATIDWGDGTTETLALTADGGAWTFAATHEYLAAQSEALVTVAVDFDGAYLQEETLTLAVGNPIGLWARGAGGLILRGGAMTINGLAYSFRDIYVRGTDKTFNGNTRYVRRIDVRGSGHTFATPAEKVPPADWPYAFDIRDYEPGGAVAEAVGHQFYDMSHECYRRGFWRLNGPVHPGLYWVPCDVRVSGTRVQANVTIVSRGNILVSGSRHKLTPFVDDLLLLTRSSSNRAIRLTASRSEFSGYQIARRGVIEATGNHQTIACGMAAWALKFSGRDRTVGPGCGALPH